MTSTQKNENVQMNEFPEGTLSLPHIGSGTSDSTYWELFILHIAKGFWLARAFVFQNQGVLIIRTFHFQ